MRLGSWGENRAAEYLVAKGYILLDRNVRVGTQELDLVMQAEGMIVFVEVKTRISVAFGPPEASVTPRKQQHLTRAAWGYLEQVDRMHEPWRFDVVAIVASRARTVLRIDHYPAAFEIGLL